jgi:lysophospholipase L1-like esterase
MKYLNSLIVSILIFFSIAISAQNKALKVACVGNSITQGAGIKDQIRDSYPSVLGRMLGNGYEVQNFGRSGATLLRNGNYPYWKVPEYQNAKSFNPDIVVIKLGSNDSKPLNKAYWYDFEKDLSNMVDTFRLLPSKPKIYLCLPVPAIGIGNFGITDSVLINVIFPQIKIVAKAKKTELIDLHSALENRAELYVDRIHPNESGAVLIAKTVAKGLTGKEYEFIPQAFAGKKVNWKGFDRYNFSYYGRNATVVVPQNPAKGNPWIMRPAFFGVYAQADSALLTKGFHVVYFDVTHLYGSPNARKLFNGFYDYLVKKYQFSGKVTLEGLSRGGMFVQNWAVKNPDKVACIYVDAPVCDIKSWPSRNNATLWNDFLKEYNITDAQADTLKCNPVDQAIELAKTKLSILSICGDADKAVPMLENSMVVRDKMVAAGGSMRFISKPGVDHHPHSLTDPTPIVDFVLQHQPDYLQKHHINLRGNLNNSRLIFENEKVGRVAFLGGSITEMKGWHTIIMEQLKQRFPHTKFEFVEAGIGSTGTTPGAYRMKKDVLEKGKIDLLFVEAAVNDDTNGFDSIAQIRGMEGEVRQALLSNPNMDIVMQHFIYDAFIPVLNQGKTPAVIQNHDKVAEYYQIPSINQAQEIAERMQAGEFDWKQFGGTHPAPLGQKYYAAAIESLFDQMWSVSYPDMQVKPHVLPEVPLNAFSYFNGKLVDPREAKVKKGWIYESPWTPKEKGTVREKNRNTAILEALTPGAELSLKFEGTAIGIYCLAGPNAGIIEYKVDGGKFKTLDLYTKWSGSLYIPWVYMFETELKDTKHKLTLKMSADKNTNSKGNACQIYYFTVNGK